MALELPRFYYYFKCFLFQISPCYRRCLHFPYNHSLCGSRIVNHLYWFTEMGCTVPTMLLLGVRSWEAIKVPLSFFQSFLVEVCRSLWTIQPTRKISAIVFNRSHSDYTMAFLSQFPEWFIGEGVNIMQRTWFYLLSPHWSIMLPTAALRLAHGSYAMKTWYKVFCQGRILQKNSVIVFIPCCIFPCQCQFWFVIIPFFEPPTFPLPISTLVGWNLPKIYSRWSVSGFFRSNPVTGNTTTNWFFLHCLNSFFAKFEFDQAELLNWIVCCIYGIFPRVSTCSKGWIPPPRIDFNPFVFCSPPSLLPFLPAVSLPHTNVCCFKVLLCVDWWCIFFPLHFFELCLLPFISWMIPSFSNIPWSFWGGINLQLRLIYVSWKMVKNTVGILPLCSSRKWCFFPEGFWQEQLGIAHGAWHAEPTTTRRARHVWPETAHVVRYFKKRATQGARATQKEAAKWTSSTWKKKANGRLKKMMEP